MWACSAPFVMESSGINYCDLLGIGQKYQKLHVYESTKILSSTLMYRYRYVKKSPVEMHSSCN